MDYKTLVQCLMDTLAQAKMAYMFVGGLAVNYWGIPRTTIDVDIVIALQPEAVLRLVRPLKQLRFDVQADDVALIARVGNSFMTHSPLTPHRVDFWIPRTDFERRAFERRRQERLHGKTAWLISPEDLVVMKLLAGREKDLNDAAGVLQRQRSRLNESYMAPWVKRLALTRSMTQVRRMLQGEVSHGTRRKS